MHYNKKTNSNSIIDILIFIFIEHTNSIMFVIKYKNVILNDTYPVLQKITFKQFIIEKLGKITKKLVFKTGWPKNIEVNDRLYSI